MSAVRNPEASASRRLLKYYNYGNFNPYNTDCVRCREVVRFSEGPLTEVRLYFITHVHVPGVRCECGACIALCACVRSRAGVLICCTDSRARVRAIYPRRTILIAFIPMPYHKTLQPPHPSTCIAACELL